MGISFWHASTETSIFHKMTFWTTDNQTWHGPSLSLTYLPFLYKSGSFYSPLNINSRLLHHLINDVVNSLTVSEGHLTALQISYQDRDVKKFEFIEQLLQPKSCRTTGSVTNKWVPSLKARVLYPLIFLFYKRGVYCKPLAWTE